MLLQTSIYRLGIVKYSLTLLSVKGNNFCNLRALSLWAGSLMKP